MKHDQERQAGGGSIQVLLLLLKPERPLGIIVECRRNLHHL